MKFGKTYETIALDERGSFVTIENNFSKGFEVGNARKRFEHRVQVSNSKDEMMEYLSFSDGLKANPDRLDGEFRIERNKRGDAEGYYYIVKCWTTLGN